MVFDASFQTIGYTIDEDGDGGLYVSMAVGMPLPISPGPGQPPMLLPVGQMKFPMARADAINLANAVLAAAEALPEEAKKPDLLITDKMPNVDVGAIDRRLKGV